MDNKNTFDSFDGGMVAPPKPKPKKETKSPDYTFRSKPARKNVSVKPTHDPERFNRVLQEAESVKEPASVLIDPEIVTRVLLVLVFLIIYIVVFR